MPFKAELHSCSAFYCVFIVYGSGGVENLSRKVSGRRSLHNI